MAWYSVATSEEGLAQLVVTWPCAVGARATLLYSAPTNDTETLRRIGMHAKQLSGAMWARYAAGEFHPERVTAKITERLADPGDGEQREDQVEQHAGALGAALAQLGDPALTAAMWEEVNTEIDAVRRASLGDLTGRAEQAVRMDGLDAAPNQVAAAHQIMRGAAMRQRALTELLQLEPAAAGAALVVWFGAALTVCGQVPGLASATAARLAAAREHHVNAETLVTVARCLAAGRPAAQIVADLAQATRPVQLVQWLALGYGALAEIIDTAAFTLGLDAAPWYATVDPLPPPDGRTWEQLLATDPAEHAEQARLAVQLETGRRIAAVVTAEPHQAAEDPESPGR